MTKAKVAGILKANGYGTGASEAFQTLYRQGCRTFFVATPDEAIALTNEGQADAQIYVLGGLYRGAEDIYWRNGILPVLNSEDDVGRCETESKKRGRKLQAALHVDTAMNRLGVRADNLPNTANIDLTFLMSHFASSEDKDSTLNDAQAQRFAEVARQFPHTLKSLCNSSGLFRHKDWHYDLIRPGIALYGGNPLPEESNPVNPVVSLQVRVLQTRDVKKGESAGYNATHVFEHDTRCATVAMGYADGFPRDGSNNAKLFWRGQPCPIRGRVSMDLVIVETGHLLQQPQEGDWLEVLGKHQSVDQLAADCGTISYNILTALGPRYHRVYSGS